MQIEHARKLRRGAPVRVPEDRGIGSHVCTVVSHGKDEHQTINGNPYLWVTVRYPWGSESVWPSNRLIKLI